MIDQSTIVSIESITASIVWAGGIGCGFWAMPTVLRGKVLGVVKVDQFGAIVFDPKLPLLGYVSTERVVVRRQRGRSLPWIPNWFRTT